MLSPHTIDIVKKTAPVVAQHAVQITKTFYPTMFRNSPQAALFFNRANQSRGEQPLALANAVVAYASNIENLGALSSAVDLIAHKHCGLQVLPQHYGIVHDNLMIAIKEVLGDAITPEVGGAWSEAVQFLAKVLIDHEESLYKAAESRPGGWRGWREFKVTAKDVIAQDTAHVTFKPADGSTAPFEFEPGQFLTVKFKAGAGDPRHYTIVSKPGDSTLQCAVRRVGPAEQGAPAGAISGAIHDNLTVGDSVVLSPPFGTFRLREPTPNTMLFSGGIGVTPIRAFAQQLHDRGASERALWLHQDRTEAAHAFQDEVEACVAHSHASYDDQQGPYEAATISAMLGRADAKPADTSVYMCGPPGWMAVMRKHLSAVGVPGANIVSETFGPTLAH